MEHWKIVSGYPNYKVSNLGRIKNINSGKILVNSIDQTGYANVGMSVNGIRKTFKIHRLIAEYFIPNPENKPEVNHINGVRSDYRIENLEWVTHAENIIHSYRIGNGNPAVGSRHGHSKLSEASVIAIRTKYSNHKQMDIAKIFNISDASVSMILNRKTWTHI